MESSTTFTLPRGFLDTTATDGGRLRIYYIRETLVPPEDDDDISALTTATHATKPTTTINDKSVSDEAANKAKRLRAAEMEVIRDFAAAYNRRDLDLNGKGPHEDVRPIGIVLVRASHHASTYTPFEHRHITVDVASEESWEEGLGFVRSGIHVFSVNNVVAMGYKNYDRKKSARKGNYDQGEIGKQLEEARSRDLKDECQGL
ncbi:hypothetical protein E4U50_008346 [Claviceps purpurea]|nr:hypothetical protein E4U50_008346 [Claviceps purpurea]KAG6222084.1 hypothetical protein E4U26_005532 [Claviceps purpurea]